MAGKKKKKKLPKLLYKPLDIQITILETCTVIFKQHAQSPHSKPNIPKCTTTEGSVILLVLQMLIQSKR